MSTGEAPNTSADQGADNAAEKAAGAAWQGDGIYLREVPVKAEDLSVAYRSGGRDITVARNVSFEVAAGQTLAVVGESGSGKSTVAGALLGHLRHGSRVTSGSVEVCGRDVLSLGKRDLKSLRARDIAMVGQNAGNALTPSMRIGAQLEEALLARALPRAERRAEARALLGKVGLPEPDRIGRRFPHQLSGGQQQRVAIAMALAARPRVLVLDEPTTALDVVTQARILDLVADLSAELGLATVLVSHDLGVVARMADHVVVMREGEVVEAAPSAELFASPRHAYTRRLLASVPRVSDEGLAEVGDDGSRTVRDRAPVPEGAPAVVTLDDVVVQYGRSRAVDGVSLGLRRGEVLALVGESGSGKSTLAWSLAGLRAPASGRMRLHGDGEGDLAEGARRRPMAVRRRVQLAFQNADTSLNPRRIAREAVRRPLRFFGLASRSDADARARGLIDDVALDPALSDRLPQQLSGGQRQRVGIARALAGGPDVVVADEVTTALDVSVQASVLALLDDLRTERDLAFVFISHDLAVVRGIADRVAVMKDGRVVEEGPVASVFAGPNHPYTRRLLAAVLEPAPAEGADTGRADTGRADTGRAGTGGADRGNAANAVNAAAGGAVAGGADAPAAAGDGTPPEDAGAGQGDQVTGRPAGAAGGDWIDLGGGHRIRRGGE